MNNTNPLLINELITIFTNTNQLALRHYFNIKSLRYFTYIQLFNNQINK